MKPPFVIYPILLFLFINGYAGDNCSPKYITLKTGFSMYPGGSYHPNDGYFKKGTKNLRIEGNYSINETIKYFV